MNVAASAADAAATPKCRMCCHMPHAAATRVHATQRERRCPFWFAEEAEEDYLVRLRLQANPFASWLPLAINAIRRTIVRHAKRQGSRA